MKPQLMLSLLGSLLGGLFALAFYWFSPDFFNRLALREGSSFESLADLRNSIAERGESEKTSDREVPLRGIVVPHTSDRIIYQLEPNRTARFRGQIVTMNSFGMRSPEVTREKPEKTKRVVVLGDSYAFGWGVKQDEVFSRWLEGELSKTAPGDWRVQVLNFGVPGYATFQEVGVFFDKAVTFSPDAVLVYFIKNDFGLPFFIRDLNNSATLLPAPEFEKQKVAETDAEGQEKRKALLRALDANRALLELSVYCKEHGLPLFLAPHPDERAGAMRSKLWVLKNSPGKETIRFIDLAESYGQVIERDNISKESLSIPRDHHPGPGAHEAIGKALATFISPVLWR